MIKATLIDYMGSDLSVVNAARVSFGNKHEVFKDKKDTKLINFLARNNHVSPFGHAFASFHVSAPIFIARQLVKHKFLRCTSDTQNETKIIADEINDIMKRLYPVSWDALMDSQ